MIIIIISSSTIRLVNQRFLGNLSQVAVGLFSFRCRGLPSSPCAPSLFHHAIIIIIIVVVTNASISTSLQVHSLCKPRCATRRGTEAIFQTGVSKPSPANSCGLARNGRCRWKVGALVSSRCTCFLKPHSTWLVLAFEVRPPACDSLLPGHDIWGTGVDNATPGTDCFWIFGLATSHSALSPQPGHDSKLADHGHQAVNSRT